MLNLAKKSLPAHTHTQTYTHTNKHNQINAHIPAIILVQE